MGVGFFFLFFLALGVLCTSWLPFLVHGIAKQRKGENSKGFITTACIWVAFWGVMIVVVSAASGTLFVLFAQVAIFLLTGWFPLLIWGALLWLCKRTSGKWRTLVAGVWCLMVVSFMVYHIIRHNQRWAAREFNSDTYTGAIATVEFPYTGEGNINLTVHPENGTPYRWTVSAVDTNRMVIPTGEYRIAYLSVCLEGVMLDFRFDTPFTVAQDEVFAFSGGFPLVASIDVYKRTGDELSLDFNLADSAGNRVTYRDREKTVGFEALSPDGEQFWRGDFEWG